MRSITSLLFLVVFVLFGCKKEEGEGGLGTIKGKVEKEYRLIPANPNSFQFTTSAKDEEVYIVYGDNVGPDDRVWTNYNGEFAFYNLRPGDYTIYVYSRDTTGIAQVDPDRMPIKTKVKLEGRRDEVNASTMRIYDTP